MTDLQGAVGLVQLSKLDAFIDERAKWAKWYHERLADVSWLQLPSEPDNGRHGWQSFVTYVDPKKAPKSRNEIMEILKEQGVSTRPGTHAVHMLGLYKDRFGYRPNDFPEARACNDQTMAIPLHNRMNSDDYEYVFKCVKGIE